MVPRVRRLWNTADRSFVGDTFNSGTSAEQAFQDLQLSPHKDENRCIA